MAHYKESSGTSQDTDLAEQIRFTQAAETALADQATRLGLSSNDEASSSEEEADDSDDEERNAPPPSLANSPSTSPKVNASSIEILRRTLSIHSIVSTTSSFAERMEKAKLLEGTHLRVIGRGTCGTIFEIPGTEVAYKKGQDEKALWNDANLTNVACKAIIETKTGLEEIFSDVSVPRVPRVYGWVSLDDKNKWWESNGTRFPEQDNERGALFQVQRILPLPKNTRIALIKSYFPTDAQTSALEDPDNKACLVRPYLGKRRSERELDNPQDNLLNYPLYMDQFEDIGVDILQFSKEMAIGLAIIHWKAGLDGMDMEFVIGSATMDADLPAIVPHFKDIKPFSVPAGDFKRRQTHLWILDFDKAQELDFKNWNVARKQMVTAVTANDPYFPNPSATSDIDKATWKEFEVAYIITAEHILKLRKLPKKAKKWPGEFLKEWQKKAAELWEDEDGDFIEFG